MDRRCRRLAHYSSTVQLQLLFIPAVVEVEEGAEVRGIQEDGGEAGGELGGGGGDREGDGRAGQGDEAGQLAGGEGRVGRGHGDADGEEREVEHGHVEPRGGEDEGHVAAAELEGSSAATGGSSPPCTAAGALLWILSTGGTRWLFSISLEDLIAFLSLQGH